MGFSFPKKERLKSRKLIALLFHEGKSVGVYGLKLLYLETPLPEGEAVQAGFSVSSRKFKSAVQRNRIKRLMREGYRLNKGVIFNRTTTQYACMFLYLGEQLPEFESLNGAMKAVLKKFEERELGSPGTSHPGRNFRPDH